MTRDAWLGLIQAERPVDQLVLLGVLYHAAPLQPQVAHDAQNVHLAGLAHCRTTLALTASPNGSIRCQQRRTVHLDGGLPTAFRAAAGHRWQRSPLPASPACACDCFSCCCLRWCAITDSRSCRSPFSIAIRQPVRPIPAEQCTIGSTVGVQEELSAASCAAPITSSRPGVPGWLPFSELLLSGRGVSTTFEPSTSRLRSSSTLMSFGERWSGQSGNQ
uniref:Uncharacterized protein n=1 Tax=Anopheles quadriannulatus TaxID=34691 RepID=A0A182XQQ3_ANOQN